MLNINNLNVSISDIPILHGVSLKIAEKNIVSVVGSNGAGKSTLLKTISGLLWPTSGEIVFNGERIDKVPPHMRVELGIVRVPEGRRIFPNMTVLENMEMGSFIRRAKGERKKSLERLQSIFPVLAKRTKQDAGTLSGGEQQMLAIARALMALPVLIMLDEPSLGLSPLLVERIFQVIGEIRNLGTTILLVEQNAYHSLAMADCGYVLENGKVAMSGRGERLLENNHIKKAYLGL
jgi:branched-chain amino acid transport system ATP-binding protein